MKRLNTLSMVLTAGAITAMMIALPLGVRAQTSEEIIHAFTLKSGDGAEPATALAADGAGNFYGTTEFGGAYNDGAVFEVTPIATGWNESLIYSFAGGATGSSPGSAGLTVDKSGNLYGTTYSGGTTNTACSVGCGLVFELSPSAGGWQETVLHNFSGSDGANPSGGLMVFDAAGNLYGVTGIGGPDNTGVVFKLTPAAETWTESVIYSFRDTGTSSVNPWGVSIDASGNLYGTAVYAGAYGFGSIFKLTPNSSGQWTMSTVHEFTGKAESGFSRTNLIFDAAGNIYGMTSGNPGGAGYGAVFKLRATSMGGWNLSVLHSFTGGRDGGDPASSLVFDAAGNLYGATFHGGNLNDCLGAGGCGVVFKLTPTTTGPWKETVLRIFSGRTDGANPNGVTLDSAGNLLGTAIEGGAGKYGVVFEIIP